MRAINLFLVMLFSIVLSACGGSTSQPTVSSVSPADNATGVAADALLSVTFNEAMDASTINSTTFTVNGISGTVTYAGNRAIFTPSHPLALSATYTATVSADVKDLAGNALGASYRWSFSTGATADTAPPTISSVSPVNNATGVAVNAAITVTFSEAVDPSTINAATFTVGGIAGTVSCAGNTATFIPSSSLSTSTAYTATVSTAVKDLAGNPLSAPYTWSFTTSPAPDTTPPAVSSVSPSRNAAGIAVNTPITATFSEAMAASSLNTASFTLNNGITGTVTYSGTTATFTPSSNLAYATTYTAIITTGATDSAGNAMTVPYTWSFTTSAAPDTTPPSVSSVSPTNNTADVAVNTPITATFSEPMAASTLNTASFTLDNGMTGTVTYSGTTATFTPSSNLAYATTYTATITTGVTDSAGNAMTVPYTWSFTTSAASPPSPPDGVAAVAGRQVAISWNAVAGADSYNVYMASVPGVTKSNYAALTDGVQYAGVNSPFVPAGLTAGKTYYFVVTAANAAGESGESLEVSARPQSRRD